MEERSDSTEKSVHEEVMLPGFRFHPTDEELVGFYLKKKIQQRPLSIELIKQLDIYKHDPWDLPKLASTAGEKEWYFYCPRDRKYRNSARPNRVTGAGFWKATGTDRPIYSSDGNKCIGLKKSLVFYKGRAAKGVKTDWMMHEFRLPSLPDNSKRASSDKTFLANDSWAICRIFKKTNSAAQRALSHSWVSHLQEPNASTNSFGSDTKTTSSSSPPVQFCNPRNDNLQDSSSNSTSFSPVDFSSLYRAYHNIPTTNMSSPDFFPSLLFPPLESSTGCFTGPAKCGVMDDIAPNPTMFLSMSSILGDSHFGCQKSLMNNLEEQTSNNTINGFEIGFPYHHDSNHAFPANGLGNISTSFDHHQTSDVDNQWESVRSSLGFPALALPNLPLNTSMADPWKPSLLWDTSPCPSANSPTTRCYT